MTRRWRLVLIVTILAAPRARAEEPPSTDFKLLIQVFSVRKTPLASAELVVRKGVAYQFITEAPDEVSIIDPARARLFLLDLGRNVQTEVTARRLDNALARVHRRLSVTAEAKAKSSSRADRVEAAMSRDLTTPRFQTKYDPASHRLRLTNPTVEVEAVGEPEPDRPRLNMIVNCLAALAKHDTLREPDALPPFIRLNALRALAADHGLRPTETTFLYRLAGPPRKQRWTYRLVPTLTDREREAIARVDRMRENAPFLPYEVYEQPDQG